MLKRLQRWVLGAPRDIRDPGIFHKISLVAFLAWVGLGADGLSSSAYGPEEAFKALEGHTELAVVLALATALTVFIISYAYSRIIEHFPHGGGGYLVATKLLGPSFGVVSGCALLIDYVLTITVSVASGADQIFSFLPAHLHAFKIPCEAAAILALILMNLRGVKESITLLAPVFLLFILTHAAALVGAFWVHAGDLPAAAAQVSHGLKGSLTALGMWGMLGLLAKAYARGAGTYTGIEAVSNGVQSMRDPKVGTAKRTMVYMATSLAVTAGGILLAYLLLNVRPEPGKTLNAVLLEKVGFGHTFTVVALLSEAALLVVAAQAGFIDGPRVMANMALDSWLPHRFTALSERLTMHYGVLLMGGAALVSLFYTGGNIDTLVTMYSINVFITFSLTEMGMVRFWIRERRTHPEWKRSLPIHLIGLGLCLSILSVVIYEKFGEGAWMTLVVTSGLIALCMLIRKHYRRVKGKMARLSEDLAMLEGIRKREPNLAALDRALPTAVLLASSYEGLGIHSLLTIFRVFPDTFRQVLFVSVAVIDSGNFKGRDEVEGLETKTKRDLDRYVDLARHMGLPAEGRMAVGIDPVLEAERLCAEIAREYPRAVFFAGKISFEREKWYQGLLHNETPHAIQRRLQWEGIPMVVLPVRVR